VTLIPEAFKKYCPILISTFSSCKILISSVGMPPLYTAGVVFDNVKVDICGVSEISTENPCLLLVN